MSKLSCVVAAVVAIVAPAVPLPAADAPDRAAAAAATVTVHLDQPAKPISGDLWGIFFEDINDAADGGLYAELVQNRSFEYSRADNRDWNSLTSWALVTRGGGKGEVAVRDADALHPNNPHHAVLTVTAGGEGVGLSNGGFGGIALKAGAKYDVSVLAKQTDGSPAELFARLEGTDGKLLAPEASLGRAGADWRKLTATLAPTATADDARLVVLTRGIGTLQLDMVSLFPQETFKQRSNGLRPDLAQAIADLRPRFVRFPGGCVAHGDGLDNMYRWKDTVGPVEQRKAQPNIWRYHQSYGLGYFEYFQFCEDIGALPLPVVPAGVCCQNSNGRPGRGQEGLPMGEMPEYVQEVLDLIEWANGPATSTWGAKRAQAGHPEPFNLKYLGVGNEDHITPVFEQRFEMIYQAVKAKHPEIVVIGTVGPFSSGPDYERGWRFADTLRLPMVDEHYYQPPAWFLNNLAFYDKYDRAKSQVYLGEYAAHDVGRRTTLRSALAEAAYMTSLERNGDVVRFASYAPLLGKIGRTRWDPNLIYFTNTRVVPTISYQVQRLFGNNAGDAYVQTTVKRDAQPATPSVGHGVLLGTWNTDAEFDDVRITSGSDVALEESFDAASASKWRADRGKWHVADGTYRQTSNAQPALSRVTTKLPAGDQKLTLRARKTGGAEGFLIGFGVLDSDNYYWWNLGGWGNRQHGVEKISGGAGGAKSIVGRQVDGSIETNRWYNIEVERVGRRIRCSLDGKVVHEFEDEGFQPLDVFAVSCVRDSTSGDVILKMVNTAATPQRLRLELNGLGSDNASAQRTVLSGDPLATNDVDAKRPVLPNTSAASVGRSSAHELPAHSLTVIRVKGPGGT